MACETVERVWDHRWEGRPEFRPADPDHDTITILTRLLREALPDGQVTFLDVGSGPGSRTIPVIGSERSIRLILLDLSRHALQRALEYASDVGVCPTHVQADGFRLPFSEGSIGFVFANGLNEHYADPLRQPLIEEMVRVTRSGGSVAIIVPNKLNPFHTLNKVVREQFGTWPFGPQFDFTPMELRRRMRIAGLGSIHLFGSGASTSWIRLFPREFQEKLYRSPTPFAGLNDFLWNIDADSSSAVNKYFGREILVVGTKSRE